MEIDVTDWFLVADWDARPESANEIASRLVDSFAAIENAFPASNGTWTL
ncbi:hypothetical protein [Curtobacterium sp. VKM Ac-2922]|nr:hypothetical protein [Curtobacterium sp. VKM Ac-2922]MCJ1713001.1 hypothetical protein [Curtobacterium sp. VKM Ac-2922]